MRVIGGTHETRVSVFGKENEVENAGKQEQTETEFVKTYSMEESGEKLRKLRPEGTEGGFSLGELNERLMKLREMEMKEINLQIGGAIFKAIRDSLVRMKFEGEEKARVHRGSILEGFGSTPEYLLHPPKEHLYEKYFHPDNVTSEEKDES